jgi:hypothetical protein
MSDGELQQKRIELGLELRNEIYEEIERQADTAASLSRSISEAAFRGDQLTVGVHIKQLRLVLLYLIKLYKEGLCGHRANDTGQAAGAAGDISPVKAGDGMGGNRPP